MKIRSIALLGCLLSVAPLMAQHDTITNYSCDFEDAIQNRTWVIPAKSKINHHWCIGNAINNGGDSALYVTTDDGATVGYTGQDAVVYAYTDIMLATSSDKYVLSFDWQAAGYNATGQEGLFVFWVPDSTDLGQPIVIEDQLGNTISQDLRNYALELDMNMGRDSLSGQSSWQAWISEKRSGSDSRLRGGRHRRLVFAWRSCSNGPINPGACIDNIAIVDARACAAPSNLKVTTQGEDSLILNWKGDSCNCQTFEVGSYSYEQKQWQRIRIDTTYYVFTNVPEGFVDFYVRTICHDTITGGEYFSAKVQESKFIYYPENHCIDYITLSEKNCYINTEKPQYVTGDYKYTHQMVDDGSSAATSRHTHHYSKTEVDPYTNGKLKTVPTGEIASTRLGNWLPGGESERAEFVFHVDAEHTPILVMKYAVVLESPDHDVTKPRFAKNLEDPRFKMDILHKGSSIGKCASADFTSSRVSKGWVKDTVTVMSESGTASKKNVVWKNWTTIGVNLADYDGDDLTIQLSTYDCSLSGHFGYAYFTLGCAKDQLDGTNCDGHPSTDFYAPEGFEYRWYRVDQPSLTLSTDRHFQVDSMDSHTYGVDVLFPEDTSCYFTLYANSQPHYPVPAFTYKQTPHDCRNFVTITNTSHVEHVVIQTHDTTYSKVDDTFWTWHDGIEGVQIPAGESAEVEFPAKGGNFHVTLDASVNNCWQSRDFGIRVKAIGERSTDTTVYRCPGAPYQFIGHNADGSTVINPKPYTLPGTYRDTLIASSGCDSIIVTLLDVLIPDTTGSSVVILQGDSLWFHNRYVSQTGIYRDTARSIYGCDSIIDTLNLYVHIPIKVQMPTYDSICADAGEWTVPFLITSGKSCTAYSLEWQQTHGCTTLPKIDSASLPLGSIELDMPADLSPNYYTAQFTFHDTLRYLDPKTISDYVCQVTLAALYPSSIFVQRWNDILAIRNADYNGGFTFIGYEWYVDNQKQANQTLSYLATPLSTSSEYRANLMTPDSVTLFTCPFVPELITGISDIPTLVERSQSIPVQGTGVATWYDMTGNALYREDYDYVITAPANAGLYLLQLDSQSDTQSDTHRTQRIVVY